MQRLDSTEATCCSCCCLDCLRMGLTATLRLTCCLISELANGQSGDQQHRLHRGLRWSEPYSDELGTVRAGRQATGRRSGIGVENEARQARTKDGAGGGPAEEQAWTRGRGMRLLKIGESRTRMRGRDDDFEYVR